MSVTIRPATAADVPWLLAELQSFDRFFGARHSLMPDSAHATETLGALIQHHVVLLADAPRGPVGFIAGVLAPHFFNPAITHLSELFWWVIPSARGSSAGARLLHAFEAIGRREAQWITMTLESDSPVDPASLLRRGYRLKETNWLMEVA